MPRHARNVPRIARNIPVSARSKYNDKYWKPEDDKIKYSKSGLVLGAVSSIVFSTTLHAAADRPNVLFILADDMGAGGLHCYGTDWLETPNIDRLYSQGMHFSDGLAAYPTCQPSRMALLSGQYGPRTGGYRVSQKHKGHEDKIKYIVPEKSDLALEKITLAECFQGAGYATAMYGKWHVGNYTTTHPTKQGFDEAVAYTGHYKIHAVPDVELPQGVCAAEYFTETAKDFIKKSHTADKPFFLYMPYYLVHKPLEAKPEYIKHFKNKLKDMKFNDKHAADIPTIAAMTKMLDDCVGELLAELDELGIAENTIVIFTSDNGSYNIDLTGPFRGQKGDTYEGGLRVPYIFKWPGRIAAGSSSDERIIGVDIYPTLLSLAGIAAPKSYPLDGADLAPVLSGKSESLPKRKVFCFYPKYAQFKAKSGRWKFSWRNVIYDGDFKLIEYPEYNEYELFNIKNDIAEEKNLATQQPEKKSTLTASLHRWLKDINAPKLELNPNYNLKDEKK